MKNIIKLCLAWSLSLGCVAPSFAEVISASANHYELKHRAYSNLSKSELWARLISPADWWHPDHTYSGQSSNLSLDPIAGGLWQENWQDGSVLHGTVLSIEEEKSLRLNAPFGPLQALAVTVIWTISIETDNDKGGCWVSFHEVASGTQHSNLEELAGAVNFVKSEAIKRLTQSTK